MRMRWQTSCCVSACLTVNVHPALKSLLTCVAGHCACGHELGMEGRWWPPRLARWNGMVLHISSTLNDSCWWRHSLIAILTWLWNFGAFQTVCASVSTRSGYAPLIVLVLWISIHPTPPLMLYMCICTPLPPCNILFYFSPWKRRRKEAHTNGKLVLPAEMSVWVTVLFLPLNILVKVVHQ